ncbi:hypothetical protein MSAN_02057100 [Mycena sanguinolenta]|uniref:Uncharacterized protein n=1 Tax=Mycena sanguinolenta TaxID=230812 RepID=A0A8H6XHG6_9AGAR|nr:hypothetical protein MSAN_02057100 [Mycena sanguinolenta]
MRDSTRPEWRRRCGSWWSTNSPELEPGLVVGMGYGVTVPGTNSLNFAHFKVYELQIPEAFDSQNPPFIFTAENHPGVYHRDGRPEIPLGLTGSKPCIIPDPELGWSNVPSLQIHVSVFEDLTFLGFIAPHIMIDGTGIATLLAAWTRLLRGDDIHTIQGMDWNAQPLAPFSSGPVKSDVPRGFFRPSSPLGTQMHKPSPDELDPKDIPRFVRVPKVFLNEAKQKIMDELKAQGSAEYVGSGDVLSAWWLKTVYGDRSLTDHTPIHIHMLRNLRDMPIFANDAPFSEPYIHNLISTFPIPPIPASAFQTESLAALALHIRRTIVAYNNDLEAIRADLRWRCAGSGSNNALEALRPCPPGAEWVVQTDLRSAKFAELDFSGAVVCLSYVTAPKMAARVVFVYPFMCTDPPRVFRRGIKVLMEDAEAVWMCATRGEKHWERIRQAGEIEFTDFPLA